MDDMITLGIGGATDDITPLILFGLSFRVPTPTPGSRVFLVLSNDRSFLVL
jgi:hypothetical protein